MPHVRVEVEAEIADALQTECELLGFDDPEAYLAWIVENRAAIEQGTESASLLAAYRTRVAALEARLDAAGIDPSTVDAEGTSAAGGASTPADTVGSQFQGPRSGDVDDADGEDHPAEPGPQAANANSPVAETDGDSATADIDADSPAANPDPSTADADASDASPAATATVADAESRSSEADEAPRDSGTDTSVHGGNLVGATVTAIPNTDGEGAPPSDDTIAFDTDETSSSSSSSSSSVDGSSPTDDASSTVAESTATTAVAESTPAPDETSATPDTRRTTTDGTDARSTDGTDARSTACSDSSTNSSARSSDGASSTTADADTSTEAEITSMHLDPERVQRINEDPVARDAGQLADVTTKRVDEFSRRAVAETRERLDRDVETGLEYESSAAMSADVRPGEDLADLDAIDVPGRSEAVVEERREVVGRALALLRDWGRGRRSEFVEALYEDRPAGYETADGWWRCVREGLAQVDAVDGGHVWTFDG